MLLLVMSLAFAAGCGDSTGPSPIELARNRAKWSTLGPASYTFEFQRQCYCLLEAIRLVRISVQEGVVGNVSDAATGESIPPAEVDQYFRITIDSLFGWVAAARQNAAELDVEFDATFGYPRDVWIDYLEDAIDDEVGFTARLLVDP
jgi:hypothetical protein